MRALMESDAVVALITERSLRSPFVISEIGAARALSQTGKKTALLPVIIGDMPIPQFIQDLYAIRVSLPPIHVNLVMFFSSLAVHGHRTS
jgi:TIR domain